MRQGSGLTLVTVALVATMLIPAGALFLGAASAWAETPSEGQFAVAVNIAGRQRMLSQKAAKEALQIVLDLDAAKSREELKGTLSLFERSLAGLATGDAALGLPAPSAAVAEELAAAKPLWAEFKAAAEAILGGAPDVDRLAAANVALLTAMQRLVKAVENDAHSATGTTWGAIVNLAGRQRMMSQKMAKQIYLIALKKDVDTQRQALKSTLELFDRTLTGLAKGDRELGLPPATDATLRERLAEAAKVWAEFMPLVQRSAGGEELTPEELRKVAELNVPLLEASDRAVKQLEVLAAGK
ncbi:MAG: type IV pili methyl-accepting chemotaxis transducer N-terminal domain-containing protein [Planctomycetes bacterium]|nr:type IV pili methyl-accepting chemotaxis transducer N-terminal domain-containing protein [Planctomycetota bacterium]